MINDQLTHEMLQEKKKLYLPLAVITAVLLLASVTVVPALDAFADHDQGNHKSKDNKDKKDKDCVKKNGKYKKNCPKEH